MSNDERQQRGGKHNASKHFGRFRNSLGRLFAHSTKLTVQSNATLAIEQLESRHLLAAQFFAPADPSGSVNVQLVPLSGVATGTQEIVTFGVPFTRGSLSQSQLAQVRVLKSGAEIPAFVEQLTP